MRSQPARSASPSRPPGRSSITISRVAPTNRSGSRSISWLSPNWRATSLPIVISAVPTKAPLTVRTPPTTSIASNRIADVERVLPRIGAADRLHAQRPGDGHEGDAHDPRRPARPEHVDADRRCGDLVVAGGDGESSAPRLAEEVGDEQGHEGGDPQPRVGGQAGDSRQSAGASSQLLPVLDDLIDGEQHGEGDHRRRQPAGAGDHHPDEGAGDEGGDDPGDGGAERPELDVTEPEREVGQGARLGGDRDRR